MIAAIVDGIIVYLASILLAVAFTSGEQMHLANLPMLVLVMTYYVYFWLYRAGRTPGKALVGVADLTN